MTEFETLLNAEQLEAATAPDGPILVLAAAGTGKTRTLVYRVAYLVDQGVDPSNVLLLTFTNRAAREMLERAQEVVGGRVSGVWGGTFHHVSNRLLRRFAERVGYRTDFAIMDRDDSGALIKQCVKDLKLTSKEFPKKDVLMGYFGKAANRQLELDVLLEEYMEDLEVDPDDIARVHRAYEERKRKVNGMDFDDLLVNGLKLVEEHTDVREAYQRRFRYVLVDEYQDTNILQAKLVDHLGGGHNNVMVVGDDFQCIYSWRGADFRNIMEFPTRYPDAQIVKLEQNYRSVPEILHVANACIEGNPEQFQKVLRPTRKSRRKPRVVFVRDGDDQAGSLLNLISRYRAEGYALSDMAVLYRAHFQSIELQMALTRARTPYVITSGVSVFEQAHVKDVLSLLRVAEVPTDALAFQRLMGLLRGVGPRTVERYWSKLGEVFDVSQAGQREALRALMRPAMLKQWEPIDALLGLYHADTGRPPGGEFVELFLEDFYETYLQRTYENADRRVDDIHELALHIQSSANVKSFLSEVALLTNIDHEYDRMRDTGEEKLHMSTVHQAKGLEWPVVFILWAVEGQFPSARSLAEAEDAAEERRLFYVAVTRARDELTIMVPSIRRMRDGGVFYCEPSRFVQEIPEELYRTLRGGWC